jgi:CheY-like chemotaxis protein
LALLDYLMPGMKGDELAQRMRQQCPSLPLIAVSAVGQLPEALSLAVDAQFQKGEDPELLLEAISNLISRNLGEEAGDSQPTILCVDDEELQLDLRKRLFEAAGYKVFEARSAQDAMEIFRSRCVDAVVMDYWLCGNNGTSIAEEMKGVRPQTPIVMLSGFTSLPGESTMVDLWLRKGDVEPEDLISEVGRLVELRNPRRPSPHK